TVDMLIEHDPDHPLSKVITRMFGEERPKLNDTEKKERQSLKLHNNAPHMTKLLLDIGQDLVQESTYCDIVHARNLPETPKNIETYKQVAAQLKPVWEALRKRNEPYKMKMLSCQVCGFKTESRMILQSHRSTVHFKNGKYQCAMCPEFDTNEQRLINHYLESHLVIASKDEAQAKYPCLICDEDFQYKGLRDTHLRTCKKDYSRGPDDQLMINRWLWERPPIDPTILQQQQAAQQQQVL
ncbi:zinc finger, C2H2 type, partial [Teladorsagia circumcincta]